MRAINFLRFQAVSLALMLAVPSRAEQGIPTLKLDQLEPQTAQLKGQPSHWQALGLPKPAPAGRSKLPAVFNKPSPASIADLQAIEQRVKGLVARVSPAVVAVEVGNGSGSGVVISADGLVLTAGHVCSEPGLDVRFTFPDGRTARGKTIGVGDESDTGLMRIEGQSSLAFAPLGDVEQARTGDWVLALGHPGGFDSKRSLVVRLGRVIRLAADALQTDCTISPGDSGGPLFDMQGRVIGIHSFISTSMTENFHVPITQFYASWDEMVKGVPDTAPKPAAYFGADGEDDDAGCRLSEVDRKGPAFKAGLRTGDVVLKVDGREIRLAASLRRWIAEAEPGESLQLEIKRGDKLISLNVKLAPEPVQQKRNGAK
jgi:serine protease Do